MILTISFSSDPFMGKTYFFDGWADGLCNGKVGIEQEKKRFHVSNNSKEECINTLKKICNSMEVGCSKTKLKLLTLEIEKSINDKKNL